MSVEQKKCDVTALEWAKNKLLNVIDEVLFLT